MTINAPGFLPPRMTAAQRGAIASPAAGLIIYDISNNKLDFYDSAAWKALVSTDVSTFVIGSIPFATGAHHLSDDNDKFFWDNTNKRLGIGTNTPAYTLDINGKLKVSSDLIIGNNVIFVDVSNGSINLGSGISGTDRFNVFSPTTGVQTGIASFYDSSSNIKFRIRDQWTASSIPPRIESHSSLGFALNTTTNAPFIWYINGTSNEKMRLTETGLGIGTNTPDAKLEITGGQIVSVNFTKTQILNGITFWVSDGTTPDGNLSGTQGDICYNGPSGQPFYCTGTTNWTGM